MEEMYKWAIINKNNEVIDFTNKIDWLRYSISKGYNFIEVSPNHTFVKVGNVWIYRP